MKIFMIGLGKMGLNLCLNMKDNGFNVVGYDISKEAILKAKENNIEAYENFEEFISIKDDVRIFWVMLKSGDITNNMLNKLKEVLKKDDIVIDGGNSDYNDTLLHKEDFESKEIYFFDTGTSGGVSGARNGACLLVGGNKEVFDKYLKDLYKKISLENGYLYTGELGSGHYLKMIHNAMLYGFMQTLGEGFELLNNSEFSYDLEEVCKVLNSASVIRGWLLELLGNSFKKNGNLEEILGVVKPSKEAQVTLDSAFKYKCVTPVIATSMYMRMKSTQKNSFSMKVISALRNEVGGHEIVKIK